MAPTKDEITVCIGTFRRTTMLQRLLRNLAAQNTDGRFEISVVVVDNDASGSARVTVEQLKKELELDLVYDVELERTIPAVRNHALRLARGNYIGIIDDDEFPQTDWLLTLYRAIRTFAVDGALGPVHPFFETQPPVWLARSRLCERPVYRTGTLLKWNQTRTGNVLLKKEVFDEHGLCFDVQMKTGGSDQMFFKEAMRKGYRFIAVEGAPVYEIVPPERWTKRYFLRRALVNGFNAYRHKLGERHRLSRFVQASKTVVAVLAYAAAVPICLCAGEHVLVNCLERGAHHLSQLCAMVGVELIRVRDF